MFNSGQISVNAGLIIAKHYNMLNVCQQETVLRTHDIYQTDKLLDHYIGIIYQ